MVLTKTAAAMSSGTKKSCIFYTGDVDFRAMATYFANIVGVSEHENCHEMDRCESFLSLQESSTFDAEYSAHAILDSPQFSKNNKNTKMFTKRVAVARKSTSPGSKCIIFSCRSSWRPPFWSKPLFLISC